MFSFDSSCQLSPVLGNVATVKVALTDKCFKVNLRQRMSNCDPLRCFRIKMAKVDPPSLVVAEAELLGCFTETNILLVGKVF